MQIRTFTQYVQFGDSKKKTIPAETAAQRQLEVWLSEIESEEGVRLPQDAIVYGQIAAEKVERMKEEGKDFEGRGIVDNDATQS